MARRRCCCKEPGCWSFEDNFGETDTTDVGSDWNEVTGQWGIEDEELVEKYADTVGASNARIFCTQPLPVDSKGEMYVEVDVPIASVEDGDKYYIWPCCPNSSAEGVIEVEFSYDETEDEWTTTITGGGGGLAATYTTPLTGTPTNVTFKVCADHQTGLVKAWVSPTVNEFSAWDDSDPGEGRYCAIGHSNIGHQNRFDNFRMEELRRGDVMCRNCFCVCEETGLGPELLATIVLGTDRAACLNGESWPMQAVLGPQAWYWEGGLVVDDDELNFRLTCGNGQPVSFNLIPLPPWGCHNSNVQKSSDGALSSCSPLALYFGPYSLGFAMDCGFCYDKLQPPGCIMPDPPADCSGEFWIVITQTADDTGTAS